ncbi:hypothetical protein M441DRAFT_330544 [Trichoderma asperellum CBS 433.97]|uniref:Uncharacterized protein n=1 Tax=Trichoderma asperellum (strain ATCC 204424 / CBS 433.97 / NBRC 101777) TaxID=1042311 RepID=A0A2T3YS50_TRIA4|nr:hypothetical protein M441DRAFT_330544 [Trichoderma asperellum CBS 433.97]PTB35392.1 hypothetical protein M441DRAFT_330544 [Trichoderma asperellum CBS 433.97]
MQECASICLGHRNGVCRGMYVDIRTRRHASPMTRKVPLGAVDTDGLIVTVRQDCISCSHQQQVCCTRWQQPRT